MPRSLLPQEEDEGGVGGSFIALASGLESSITRRFAVVAIWNEKQGATIISGMKRAKIVRANEKASSTIVEVTKDEDEDGAFPVTKIGTVLQ